MDEEISLEMFTGNMAFLIGEDNKSTKIESYDDIGQIEVTFPSGRKFIIDIEEEEPDTDD